MRRAARDGLPVSHQERAVHTLLPALILFAATTAATLATWLFLRDT